MPTTPSAPPRQWSLARRWRGNLLPLALSLPFLGAGLATYDVDRPSASGPLALMAAFPVVGWVALNLFAPMGDRRMRQVLERRLAGRFPEGAPSAGPWFVGFARPAYSSALDPHEDVGFLFLMPDEAVFVGEVQRASLPREAAERVAFRANPHTWLGLGGWTSIEGRVDGRDVRLMVEPREAGTMLGNRRRAQTLRRDAAVWAAGRTPPSDAKPDGPPAIADGPPGSLAGRRPV